VGPALWLSFEVKPPGKRYSRAEPHQPCTPVIMYYFRFRSQPRDVVYVERGETFLQVAGYYSNNGSGPSNVGNMTYARYSEREKVVQEKCKHSGLRFWQAHDRSPVMEAHDTVPMKQ